MMFLCVAILAASDAGDHKVPAIVLLGQTGSGKSQLANLFAGDTNHQIFETSERGTSYTRQTQQTVVEWLGDPENGKVRVVDTPGLGDSRNGDDGETDSDNIRNMVEAIHAIDREHGGIERFIVVFNGQEPRFTSYLQRVLTTFGEVFTGPDHDLQEWLSHVSFVFTRWGYGETDIRRRTRTKETEEARCAEFNKLLSAQFKTESPCNVNCYFLDSESAGDCLPTRDADQPRLVETETERKRYFGELALLKQEIDASSKFPCSDMTAEPGYIAKIQRQRRHAELALLWQSHAWKLEAAGVAVTAALADPTSGGYHYDLAATAAGVYAMHQYAPSLVARAGRSIGPVANRLINSQKLEIAKSIIRPVWTATRSLTSPIYHQLEQPVRKKIRSVKDATEETLLSYVKKLHQD